MAMLTSSRCTIITRQMELLMGILMDNFVRHHNQYVNMESRFGIVNIARLKSNVNLNFKIKVNLELNNGDLYLYLQVNSHKTYNSNLCHNSYLCHSLSSTAKSLTMVNPQLPLIPWPGQNLVISHSQSVFNVPRWEMTRDNISLHRTKTMSLNCRVTSHSSTQQMISLTIVSISSETFLLTVQLCPPPPSLLLPLPGSPACRVQ